MKRFAAIVTIVVVVLAMSAGTAFASVCAGGTCDRQLMVCPDTGSMACPMNAGATMAHSECGHPIDRGARDVVSAQTATDHAVVSTPLAVVPAGFSVGSLAPLALAADARGAPHLTTVIRI